MNTSVKIDRRDIDFALKDNLEPSIIKNAPFRARFIGMITY
jgi:hypothetical protein